MNDCCGGLQVSVQLLAVVALEAVVCYGIAQQGLLGDWITEYWEGGGWPLTWRKKSFMVDSM